MTEARGSTSQSGRKFMLHNLWCQRERPCMCARPSYVYASSLLRTSNSPKHWLRLASAITARPPPKSRICLKGGLGPSQ